MGNSESVLKEKKVVVVGGGYGGAHAVDLLRGKCQLTVLDPREYYHYCVGSLRATVEPGLEKKILIPYKEAWQGVYRQGKVTAINPDEQLILLEDGDKVSYDVVIIATGCHGHFPGKIDLNVKTMAEAEKLFKEKQEQVKKADRITIIGAGAVGVEMSAEIATEYPTKKVTVISSGSDIIQGPFKKQFRDGARKQLQKLGVTLVLEERVSNFDDLPTDGSSSCTVKTDKGTEIDSDLIIISTGLHVNSEAYERNFVDVMDENKHLKVNKYMQVEGHSNVFAIGDCSNADKVKMAYKAGLHMEVVAKNIIALFTNGKMTPYKEQTVMMLTLGRYGGITQFGSLIFGPLITRYKSRDVFIGKTRSMVLKKTRGTNYFIWIALVIAAALIILTVIVTVLLKKF
ncbi:Apoptosis-inducing factor 2 [Holothuria leucospilota]|uniref:Ferroptosis suppressor protein 1 n=1 Tax=Holothuria leucospilota TaxID=206669 RepID=A0A9Q1BQ06_HOLLE|nr:Apoptosis-inducing factor 2 [Holothuria leucospilota]